MRDMNSDALALLARITAGGSESIPVVQLVEMQLAETVRLTTAGGPVTWAGNTWKPAGLGRIEPIDDNPAEMQALQFVLPGVSAEQLSLALNEDVEGKTVRVYDALIDPATGVVADAILIWSGTLNVPTIADGSQDASIVVTAEHRGVSALRAKPSRYTNDEQQRLYPGDTCLNFDPATDAAPIVWPAASYFKK